MEKIKKKLPPLVGDIHDDTVKSLKLLRPLYGLTEGEHYWLQQQISSYARSLKRVHDSKKENEKRHLAEKFIFNSFAAKVCATLRVLARRGGTGTYKKIIESAKNLDPRKALKEPVTATWVPKSKGFRVIVADGPNRTAQRLLLRDALSLTICDSEFDATKKRGGGERSLIKSVVKAMETHHWWVTADVKDCFPSLRPKHFEWLWIDKQLLANVAFTPKCTRVIMRPPENMAAVLAYLGISSLNELVRLTTKMVRQGLPQGSVLSPLLARGFLGREIRASLGGMGVVAKSFMDDLALGALSRTRSSAAVDALKTRLKSHPAGPVFLESSEPTHKKTRKVTVLGYILEPGKGFGNNPVHVKPGPKRTNRFKLRLAERLKDAPKDYLHEVGRFYWKHWYGSQQAWTKVPHHSRLLSENITVSYIEDFRMGIAMGENWKPKKSASE